jgi:DNA-binding PucR family transcriptional regulator
LLRLDRRAAALGVPRAAAWQPLVIDVGRELEDGGPEAARFERALVRPERPGSVAQGPVVAIRRGRIVALVPGDRERPDVIAAAEDVAMDRPPIVLRGRRAEALEHVGSAVAEAMAALDVATRARSAMQAVTTRSVVLDQADLALELAILADPARLATAVEHELGPILEAPRAGSRLVETLRTWLDHRQNLQGTARALGVAPRTVAYRLERVERLTGRPLDGAAVRRFATALFAADLLDSLP